MRILDGGRVSWRENIVRCANTPNFGAIFQAK